MIVVDTNVIAHLLIPGKWTEYAKKLLLRDPDWVTAPLWRSEMRNVLFKYYKHSLISIDRMKEIMSYAEGLFCDSEIPVTSEEVIEFADLGNISAYDAEFVALAKKTKSLLITTDKQLIVSFPKMVKGLEEYGREE